MAMNSKKVSLLISFCLLSFFAFSQKALVTNVHIVSMDGKEVLKNQAVYILDGKIDQIIPLTAQTPRMYSENLIDGQGAYIFPGLAEFHAHLPVENDGNTQLQEESMWLYLANGVLIFRIMLCHHSNFVFIPRVKY
mgnify:CR=1 FL=1